MLWGLGCTLVVEQLSTMYKVLALIHTNNSDKSYGLSWAWCLGPVIPTLRKICIQYLFTYNFRIYHAYTDEGNLPRVTTLKRGRTEPEHVSCGEPAWHRSQGWMFFLWNSLVASSAAVRSQQTFSALERQLQVYSCMGELKISQRTKAVEDSLTRPIKSSQFYCLQELTDSRLKAKASSHAERFDHPQKLSSSRARETGEMTEWCVVMLPSHHLQWPKVCIHVYICKYSKNQLLGWK